MWDREPLRQGGDGSTTNVQFWNATVFMGRAKSGQDGLRGIDGGYYIQKEEAGRTSSPTGSVAGSRSAFCSDSADQSDQTRKSSGFKVPWPMGRETFTGVEWCGVVFQRLRLEARPV